MKTTFALAAAGTLAFLLAGAPALRAQNTTVTTRGRNGTTTTRIIRGNASGFAYQARNASSAIPAGTRDFIYTPDPLTGIIVQRPVIAAPIARDGQISVDGSAARAVRSGQPLQMINPFAPASFGDGSDMVRREPDDPEQRPRGFKLLTFEF